MVDDFDSRRATEPLEEHLGMGLKPSTIRNALLPLR